MLSNETDVREDVLMPLLTALGYSKGTEADIVREHSLRYPALQLGRKSLKDPPLRGRADYILQVFGYTRWVLEAKPPTDPVEADQIEQALSYARHPEVGGCYAAICNGHIFSLHDTRHSAEHPPLLHFDITNLSDLIDKLRNILSPYAIKRDHPIVRIDTGITLGGNLRSLEYIDGGCVEYKTCTWDLSSMPISLQSSINLNFIAMKNRIVGYRAMIEGGSIERYFSGQIVAKIAFFKIHANLDKMSNAMSLEEVSYVCLDNYLSQNPSQPS
jgi:hypothetical protein